MVKVLAVTEYYNESDNIPGLVENLAAQTQAPDLWLIIDDGSTDKSTESFESNLKRFEIPYLVYRMPPKKKPNANLKGRAFTKVDILNSDWLESNRFDYLMLVGADTRFPRTYIELGTKVMEGFPEVGALAGRIHGEAGSDTPMGTGKIVRWEVVKETSGRYWDLDPDSLWNIVALNMGYRLVILKDLLARVTRPTHMYAPSGFYNYGARMHYVGWSPFLAIIYTFVLAARGTYPLHFLRGYLHEFTKRDWRCRDPEIVDFYGLRRMIRRALGLVPMRDRATIVTLGIDKETESNLRNEFLERTISKIRTRINDR